MSTYLIRRILWIIPVLVAVSMITFILMKMVPGGPWSVTDRSVSPALIEAFKRKYGLDLPLHEQYLNWIFDFIRFDLGPSYRYVDRGVNAIIADGLGTTIQLGLMAFVVAVAIGIPLGVMAALGHNRLPDYLSTGISIVGIATPSFVLAIVLVLVFSLGLNWFPATSSRWGDWHAWVLPTIALAGFPIAQIARYTRASMLEVTRRDFVRTARSKGLRENAVVVRHMVRNALIPVVTVLGPILAFLVTGSFVIEYFFGVPGIGRFYVQSIGTRDYSLLMAMTVLYAFVIAAMNVVVDVLYAYVDPRIRYS